jgi:alpha-galactosidase
LKYAISLLCLACLASLANAGTLNLSQMNVDSIYQDYGFPRANKSVDEHPLTIAGQTFDDGIGSHANMSWVIELDGKADHFSAQVGIDDDVKASPDAQRAAVEFRLVGDNKELAKTASIKLGMTPTALEADLQGVHTLVLEANTMRDSVDYDHVDWVNVKITYSGAAPHEVQNPKEELDIRTPKPGDAPRINGARVFGVRPGHPVLYMIAATGQRPMTFSAEGLPAGISLDPATGRITGSTDSRGDWKVKLRATNSLGSAESVLVISVGDKIALTPPMGWNSWNCFAGAVSDDKVRAAADAMVSSGLINHGWTYINIDDTWEIPVTEPPEKRRAPDGTILTNSKFPDMKTLADYVHSNGLKIGIYSSPGPSTCGGYTASYQFEEKDAAQLANWGFDYLKYDWCSYGKIADGIRKSPNPPTDLEIDQHPYLVMRDALLHQNRDILFSFCQYGMGDVWKWGEATGGNCWRTTGDINDTWRRMSGIGFSQNGHEKYAGPGRWNDPDMLVVGKVGWGPKLRTTRLTPNEQYTHITLWSLLDSPLLIGCDMTQLDDFTTGLLTNDEVIAVNQDSLGKQAARVSQEGEAEVWAKDMADGSKAVGLFNRGELPADVTVKWADLGLDGKQRVRDLWRQKDLGEVDGQFTIHVARHGAELILVGK